LWSWESVAGLRKRLSLVFGAIRSDEVMVTVRPWSSTSRVPVAFVPSYSTTCSGRVSPNLPRSQLHSFLLGFARNGLSNHVSRPLARDWLSEPCKIIPARPGTEDAAISLATGRGGR
jgi:hypothetical protein